MWDEGGGNEENPRPYLKTTICRVISIAAVVRAVQENGEVALSLPALPHDVTHPKQISEIKIQSCFLKAVGDKKPQLVGFNSSKADMKILVQRAKTKGVQAEKICKTS